MMEHGRDEARRATRCVGDGDATWHGGAAGDGNVTRHGGAVGDGPHVGARSF
jgi:hypothetical protein